MKGNLDMKEITQISISKLFCNDKKVFWDYPNGDYEGDYLENKWNGDGVL